MQIFVKSLDGDTYTIKICRKEDISSLKSKFYDIAGIYPSAQKLVFKGRSLVDYKTLEEFGITENSIIFFMLRLPGG